MSIAPNRHLPVKSLLWLCLLVYLFVSGFTIMHHEMWGDEIHSWNIAKGSKEFSDLIYNTRFEGHPPVWYSILWLISKFTHNLAAVQIVHWVIASCTIILLLFFSKIPIYTRVLIPFGYFFVYEYTVLSRNYAIAILVACCICIVVRSTSKFRVPIYYALLLVLSNTHLLGLILAGSLHLYFLIFDFEQKLDKRRTSLHILSGIIVFLPALYFIFPPSDSQLNTSYWLQRWNREQIKAVGQGPLRSFIPIPSWWQRHFWNTQFLLDADRKSRALNLAIAMVALSSTVLVLWRNKKSLVLFLANLFASLLIALLVFPLTSARYAGFLFIGFFIAYWLYCYEETPRRFESTLINLLLLVQLLTGMFMISKDIRLPFSNASRVNELLNAPPAGSRVVTDYWAMNTISAFADKPIHCIDIQQDLSFVLWGPELGKMFERTNRYCDGIKALFKREGRDELYMISTGAPHLLDKADPLLFKLYDVRVVERRDGAIEKGGNLYLYHVKVK